MIKTATILLSVLTMTAVLSADEHAAASKFDFKDPKGVNNVSFTLDAPLESISGSASGISGTVEFDPMHPEGTNGMIVVDATSLTVTNDSMQNHMHGDGWLDTATHGEITFEVTGLSHVEKNGMVIEAHATGIFSLKGVSKEITVPVKLTYLPGRLGDRTNGRTQGDLLVIRSTFSINRSEFGIKPGQSLDKVADDIELKLSIAGASPKS